MWKALAQAWNLNIPEEELERIAPVLDDLFAKVRPALDRDLSHVEPAAVFRLRGGRQ